MIEQHIRDALLTSAAVTALIGIDSDYNPGGAVLNDEGGSIASDDGTGNLIQDASVTDPDADLGGNVIGDDNSNVENDAGDGNLIQDATHSPAPPAPVTYARVYYTDIKQGSAFPAISMFQVSGSRGRILTGPDGWNSARYQIDCWAKTFGECRQLWDALRLALDGFKGTSGGNPIASISLTGERVFYESDPKLHRISTDALVWHRELRP